MLGSIEARGGWLEHVFFPRDADEGESVCECGRVWESVGENRHAPERLERSLERAVTSAIVYRGSGE